MSIRVIRRNTRRGGRDDPRQLRSDETRAESEGLLLGVERHLINLGAEIQ
jgi:hypothetical protein